MQNNFIEKTDVSIDLPTLENELLDVLSICPWPKTNQIGFRHRIDASDFWLDSSGSLYDFTNNKIIGTETEFTEWNPHTPEYLKNIITELSYKQKFSLGRVRLMRLMPKTGLSVHSDFEKRYHLVLKTNPYSYFCHTKDNSTVVAGQHLPKDGYFYCVDTTQEHFVYNGGKEERIHLVINALG